MAWRPTAGMRAFLCAVAIALGAEACACFWRVASAVGGWRLAPEGVLMAGLSAFCVRYVARSSIVLKPDRLIVSNTMKTYAVPLEEIANVSATTRGLRISCAGGTEIVAGAVQKSRWAMDHGNPQTRADDVVSDILAAQSRLTSASADF